MINLFYNYHFFFLLLLIFPLVFTLNEVNETNPITNISFENSTSIIISEVNVIINYFTFNCIFLLYIIR